MTLDCVRTRACSLWFQSGIVFLTVLVCYYNSLNCGFVFDDVSAIKENRDLRPHTSVWNLFKNDFWGTPMHKERSHKSYRPLCVLTFRWNYALHQLEPMGYHLFNLLLHSAVCLLYLRLCSLFLKPAESLVAAILFAVHPIHTEAVSGVVGRAEILCSVFFLAAFFSYCKCSKRRSETNWPYLVATVFLTVTAMLCKEQGLTVIAVCIVYELCIVQKLRPQRTLHLFEDVLSGKSSMPTWLRETSRRVVALLLSAIVLLVLRLKVMGGQLPTFTRFDNPASVAATPTRQLTYNYLLAANTWMLLFPCNLCCDWTMGTIPLVDSVWDSRNLATLAVYAAGAKMAHVAFVAPSRHAKVVIMSLSLLLFPFLPASNLFFPVGFVVAERVLYTPSMGFCMLVAHGWGSLLKRSLGKNIAWLSLISLMFAHASKTIIHNFDWESEYTIFMAGLRVNQRNAKLFNNVGHALESMHHYDEALVYFQKAASVQDDDVGAYINVGRTYNNLKLFHEAEAAFLKAKGLLPKPVPGESYQAKVAPNHLNVFLNLANLISRNESRLEEADALYRQAISMRSDYTQAYINRGDVLIKMNRTKEAQEVYEKALEYDNNNPDIYYNLGVVLIEQGKAPQALAYLNKALEFDPDHEQALMNSAILIQETGNPGLRNVAYDRLLRLIQKGHTNENIFFNLGMLAMDSKDYQSAEKWFKKAVQVKEDFRSALFNLALLLSDEHRPLEAAPFLNQLLKHHSDHIKGLILLGDIYINNIRDLDAAEECYRRILVLDPNNVQGLHNLCVVYVERGDLEPAEQCFIKAVRLAPHEEYIQRHLRIVRNVLGQQRTTSPVGRWETEQSAMSAHPHATLDREPAL